MKTKIFRTCVTKILALLLAVCLAAGFTPFTVGASEKTGQAGICFEDVKESDWYYEAVNYVSSRGIMTGMSEKIFGLLEKNITMPEKGERNFLEQYEKDGTLYGMKDLYSENFSIGVALEPRTLNVEKERRKNPAKGRGGISCHRCLRI